MHNHSMMHSPPQNRPPEVRSPKNRVAAFVMALFFGMFGLHRFYVGKFWTALFFFFTGGGFGVWWVIDLILILLGRFKDAEGRVLGPPQEIYQHPYLYGTEKQLNHQLPASLKEPEEEEYILDDPLLAEFEELEREMAQQKK